MTKLCIKGVVPTRACASCGVEYPATIEYFDGDDNASLEPYCLDCAVEQTSQEIEKVLRRIAEHHDEGTSEAFRAAYRSYKQHREVRSLPKSGDRHD